MGYVPVLLVFFVMVWWRLVFSLFLLPCCWPRDGVVMSMQPMPWPVVPALTVLVARAAFPKGSLAVRVRDELGAWCPDEAFAGVYGVRGRPGLSPAQLMVVTVLQFTENLTDRQAADAVRGRIDWKYCLGLELADPGFDFSVLSEFRTRLVRAGREKLLLTRLKELGLVGAGMPHRADSTHVLARIRELNRLELAGESVRAALEALSVAAPGWLAQVAGPLARRVGPGTQVAVGMPVDLGVAGARLAGALQRREQPGRVTCNQEPRVVKEAGELPGVGGVSGQLGTQVDVSGRPVRGPAGTGCNAVEQGLVDDLRSADRPGMLLVTVADPVGWGLVVEPVVGGLTGDDGLNKVIGGCIQERGDVTGGVAAARSG